LKKDEIREIRGLKKDEIREIRGLKRGNPRNPWPVRGSAKSVARNDIRPIRGL
jgi:hypothetical protein